jgi:ribosomal protein S27AE
MRVVKSQFKFPSNKLDYVAQTLGVGSKVKHSGFDLWLKCMDGDETAWKEMKRYQIQDVNLLVDLYQILLPWISNHPSYAIIDNKPNTCVNCGEDKLIARGLAHTNTASYQRYVCKSCGKWQRGVTKMRSSTTRSI